MLFLLKMLNKSFKVFKTFNYLFEQTVNFSISVNFSKHSLDKLFLIIILLFMIIFSTGRK